MQPLNSSSISTPRHFIRSCSSVAQIRVKAGCDPVALKKQYGERIAFHGGINAVYFNQRDKLRAEMERIVPVMKKDGGYWLSSDHSVPDSTSLEDFRYFVETGKKLGKY